MKTKRSKMLCPKCIKNLRKYEAEKKRKQRKRLKLEQIKNK